MHLLTVQPLVISRSTVLLHKAHDSVPWHAPLQAFQVGLVLDTGTSVGQYHAHANHN